MELENYIVGIDFGTTYSCISVWKDGGLMIIPNGIGERTTPSVVIFDSPDKVFVGEETLYHLPKNDTVKIYEIKRFIGKKYDAIKDLLDYFPYKIIKEKNGDRPKIQMTFGKKTVEYYAEEIATLIFRKLISSAQAFLGKEIKDVLITFPADFSEAQKNAVRFSAEKVPGVKVLQVLNEPSAAVLAYGFPRQLLKNKFFPFNRHFTLMKSKNEEVHPMEDVQEVDSTDASFDLISNDTIEANENMCLINCSLLSNQTKQTTKIIVFDLGGGTYDVSLIYSFKGKIFEAMAYSGDQRLGGSDFDNKLIDYSLKDFCTKNKYDEKNLRKDYKLMQRLKRACEETKKYLSDKVEDNILIEDFYESKPLCCHITRAKFEQLCKDLFLKLENPLDLILQEKHLNNTDIDEIVFVGGSSKIPKVKQIILKKFPNVKINDQISPDEAVAFGASIHAESLRRIREDFWKDFNYIDKTGHSIGIEAADGSMEVIIPKGVRYPTSRFKFFTNEYDDQYTFDIKIYEGENKYVFGNELIGEFTLENIPKKPKGQLILKVTIKIEKNQSVNVTAFVKEGEARNNIIINRNNQYPNINNNENLILDENDLNGEEKKILSYIFEYSKNFRNQTEDRDKYDLIKKYNIAVINYLDFLEDNYHDTSSEKYLFLLEKLFKSYSYFFNTSLIGLVELNEKEEIKKSIESYLKKISNKAPFRIKQLLNYFKNVKNENFIQRLEIIVFSMELIYQKAMNNFLHNENNYYLFSKTLFEECLSIANNFIKDEEQGKMDLIVMKKYKDIKNDCDKRIKFISAVSLSEIKSSKEKEKLFDNKNKLEKDDLNLLSYNLNLAIKKINNIENLNQNEEALETKSFYLANIVKIEFLKKEKNLDFERLHQYAQDSIKIAKNLKKDVKNKSWYKEIVNLNEDIEKELMKPAPPINNKIDIDEIEEKFMQLLDQGNEALLRYILQNHPYNGYTFSEESIEQYKQDKLGFLNDLRRKYSFNDFNSYYTSSDNTDLNDKIVEYIDQMIERL